MYSDGRMDRFYQNEINARYNVDEATRKWQALMQQTFDANRVIAQIHACLVDHGFARDALPPVRFLSHHRTHAAGAFLLALSETPPCPDRSVPVLRRKPVSMAGPQGRPR